MSTYLDQFQRFVIASGWSARAGKPVPYGEQLIISDGTHEAMLNFYPKRGKTLVGGPSSLLRTRIEAWVAEHAGPPAAPAPGSAPRARQEAQIGADESGKGDWFGPLVVAAVYLDADQAVALQRAGVRDSKEIERDGLAQLARLIEQTIPAPQRFVMVLAPEDYNRRYAEYANINLLLAQLYVETVGPVWRATKAATIVCDQFSQRADRLAKAFSAAGLPQPQQRHHAESTSLAVAAASILASARFTVELGLLGCAAGLRGPLPSGASDIRALERAARAIIQQAGPEGLARYAKLNFKPVRALLGLSTDDG
jgi:ribonuclease HIII